MMTGGESLVASEGRRMDNAHKWPRRAFVYATSRRRLLLGLFWVWPAESKIPGLSRSPRIRPIQQSARCMRRQSRPNSISA
jgi:hypothetical protein